MTFESNTEDPLHKLLMRVCLPDENGRKSIKILARQLDISPWAVHKWVKTGKVPPARAVQMVNLNPHEVTLANFSPFVYV